jgi:hypothetical protein
MMLEETTWWSEGGVGNEEAKKRNEGETKAD